MEAETLSAWFGDYGRAWAEQSPALARTLFTEDAEFQEVPFDAPIVGAATIAEDYKSLPASQRDVAFESSVLATTENGGVVEWHATFERITDGARMRVSGVATVEIEDGRCRRFRQWWHDRETLPGTSDALLARADAAIARLERMVDAVERLE